MQPSRSRHYRPSSLQMAAALCCPLMAPYPARAEVSEGAAALTARSAPKLTSGVVPIALPTYAPETQWAVGAALIYYRRLVSEPTPRTSVKLGVVGTQKRQFSVSTVVDQYFIDRALRLSFVGSARRFPDSFWPIGASAPESSQEHYRRDELTADIGLLCCDRRGLCGGPTVRVERHRIAEAEAGGVLASGQVAGATGTTAWSTGLCFESDSRDSVYFPHGGGLGIAKLTVGQADSGGRAATLGRLDLDVRSFFQLHGDHVLALQGMVQLRAGETPFELMPLLGGDALLRGYYQGRYRDQQLLALQLEYRFPVFWRLGGVLFGGCGEVADDIGALASSALHAAGGGGVRVTLDREAHINLRVDIAANQRGAVSGYLSIAEAF